MIASQNRHVEVVDTLLQHGASVDLQNNVSAKVFYYALYIMCNKYIPSCS